MGHQAPLTADARLAVAGTGFTRALAELLVFGYLPIQLHSAGEGRFTVLALVTAIPALVRFVASSFWGAASSRSGRVKPYLLLGFGGYIAVALLLMVLSNPWASILTVGAGSLLFSAVPPLSKSLVSLQGEGSSSRSLAGWLQAEALGWLAGGVAVSLAGETAGGFKLLLGVAAALMFLEALLILVALPEVRPVAVQPRHRGPGLLELAGLLRNPRVWVPLAAFVTLVIASEGTFTVYGVYLTGILGGSERLYGASLTVSTLLGVIAYRLLADFSHRVRPERLLPAAATAYGVTYAILAAWRDPWVMALLYSLPLFSIARAGVIWQVAQESTPAERSAAMGFLDGSEALAMGVGALAAGAIADGLGFGILFALFAAAAGLAAVASSRHPEAEAAGGRRPETGSGQYSL